MKLSSREIFLKAPREGMLVSGYSYYTRQHGLEKMRLRSIGTRDDTEDFQERSFSLDNGRTWSEWESIQFIFMEAGGTRRRYGGPGFVDPVNGRLLSMVLEGVLPTDQPLEGMKQWFLSYRVSLDGGRTNAIEDQVIQRGDYSPEHPIEGVWIGKNSMSDPGRPLRTRAGGILVPAQPTPLGPNGEYYNPGGGYTYHEAVLLIGTWSEGTKIEWQVSQRVVNDPAKSTRGCLEPTLAEMPDGRILMVLRGSNGGSKDPHSKIPGYKWYSVSEDGGYHWSAPAAWTYGDGGNFYSPSSLSALFTHSNGRIYWFGNITKENPKANSPRYPLVAGEVDPASLRLRRDTVVVIDDRQPGEDESLQLSNFFVDEDRQTGEMLLHLSRFVPTNWSADASLYRIEP